ncbi:MAG: P1 family peptidase [Thermodesulfobacteriota bacterium]
MLDSPRWRTVNVVAGSEPARFLESASMEAADRILHDDITDVPGIRVGHASDLTAKTGVTVILGPPWGVPAGFYSGGTATSTRQFDSLRPLHLVDRVHGICLCGGSAFGLDAAGGVLAWLEEQEIGIPVVGKVIPIVPTAAVFDLNFGDGSIRPNAAMGREACMNLGSGPIEQGSVGVGTGASVGKLFGIGQGMKGGLGSASVVSADLSVAALVVVNAYGDVTDPDGNVLAGARVAPDSHELADAARLLKEGIAVSRRVSVENTTLAVIAVDAALDKIAASRVATQATLGLGSVIRPFHSHIDGDLTIVLAVGNKAADPLRIALMASEALQKAVIKAIRSCDGFGILPAWKDLPSRGASI